MAYGDQYKLGTDLEHFLKGLAAAGIPEWPFGFEGDPKDRVTGEALKALVLGQTWDGNTPLAREKDAPFMLQIDAQSRVAYRGANTFLTGEARVENDQICMRFDGYYKGRWLCGNVFRDTTSEQRQPAKATSTCCPTGCDISRSNPDAERSPGCYWVRAASTSGQFSSATGRLPSMSVVKRLPAVR